MLTKTKTAALSLLVVSLLALSAPITAVFAAPSSAPSIQAKIAPLVTKVNCPDCWAGYGANATGTSSAGTVTGVSASITVPTVTANCGSSGETGSTQIVAIDGFAGDFALAGIEEICDAGVLYYESAFYNAFDGSSNVALVNPGDSITMSVTESAGTYTFTVTDATTPSGSLTGTGSASGALLNYATCFNDMFGGIGQVNFGTVSFSACSTTIAGHTHSVGKGPGLIEWRCYNALGTKALDATGKLVKSTGDFTVTFHKSGP